MLQAKTATRLVRNEVLRTLAGGEFAALRPYLTRVHLVPGQILHEAGERIEHAYFIEQGVVSLVADVDVRGPGAEPGMTEIGMIGREGLVGLTALLQAEAPAFNRSLVQIPGVALRIPAPVLREVAASTPALQYALHRALHILMSMTAQTSACNSRHSLPERLARWLLIAHDRVDGDELLLTQEFLSIMLGVRRSGVTVASAALEQAGLIRHSRGRVIINNRDGLERFGCNCYARVRTFTEKLPERDGTLPYVSVFSSARTL